MLKSLTEYKRAVAAKLIFRRACGLLGKPTKGQKKHFGKLVTFLTVDPSPATKAMSNELLAEANYQWRLKKDKHGNPN